MQLLNKKYVVLKDSLTIRETIKFFNKNSQYTNYKGFGVLLNEAGRCIATVTDGDIRRSLETKSLDTPVKKIANYNFKFIYNFFSTNKIIREFENLIQQNKRNILSIPVLSKKKYFLGYLNYNNFFSFKKKNFFFKKNLKKKINVLVPGRLSLSGGGLDFSDIINRKEIYVLSVPINKFIKIFLKNREDNILKVFVNKKKIFHDKIKNIEKLRTKNFILSILSLTNLSSGLDVNIVSSIEEGSGLGGSSALTAGLIYGIHYLKYDEKLKLNELANYAYLIERMRLGIIGGWQDFYGTIYGDYKFISFNNQDVKVENLTISNKIKKKINKNLIFFKFGKKRSSTKIQKNRKKLKSNNQLLIQMNENTKKIKKFLINGNIKKIGSVILDSWEIKKKINPSSTNSLIETTIEDLVSLGCYGCKVLGAGRSGYLMVLAKPSMHFKVKNLIKKNFKHVKLKPIKNGLILKD